MNQKEYRTHQQASFDKFLRDKEQWAKELIEIGLSEDDAYSFAGCVLPDHNRLMYSKETILGSHGKKGWYGSLEFINDLSMDVLNQIFELFYNEKEIEKIETNLFNEKLLTFCVSSGFGIEFNDGNRIVLVKI